MVDNGGNDAIGNDTGEIYYGIEKTGFPAVLIGLHVPVDAHRNCHVCRFLPAMPAMARLRIAPLMLVAAAVGIAAATALLIAAETLARRRAVDAVSQRARASAILLASRLRRELQTFRLVTVVLADDREAHMALATRDPARLAALDRKLEALTARTRAAAVYLMDADGLTVASSNWRRADSFVGNNYDFRDYFRQAMRRSEGQQFALGTSSGKPGFYMSNRLTDGGRPIGVIAVKVVFDALETEWRQTRNAAFATNRRGIILVTSNPRWRFQTVAPLPVAELQQARRLLEFGAAPLTVNPLYAGGQVARADTDAARPLIEVIEPVADDWRIHVLAPTGVAVHSAVTSVRLSFAIAVLVASALYLLWRYRRRVAAARLEATTTARLGVLNDRLVQANKLATLGQVTAGVGHEISQPVAAIAAYAHNARALIDRDRLAEAVEAMERITALTTRIGIITRELRGFARRASEERGPVSIDEAMQGAQLLLRERLRTLGAEVNYDRPAGPVRVMAEHVRLEQVLVNLLGNALEAGARVVTVYTRVTADRVAIVIADDGPGLSPEARTGLFQPFTTSKKDGLGLGLVISRDIIVDLDGTLEPGDPPRGAEFIVTLERAP